MTARARKPDQFEEVLRVLRVFDLLADGLMDRSPFRNPDPLPAPAQVELLKVAQSIAARTEEPAA